MSREIFKIKCSKCGWKGTTEAHVFYDYNIEEPSDLKYGELTHFDIELSDWNFKGDCGGRLIPDEE